jgi:hypothetical protein
VADLRWNDKRHPSSALQQTSGSDKERRPGRGEAGELCSEPGTVPKRARTDVSAERLVADEGRVPGGAIEPLVRVLGPGEEFSFMNQSPRRAIDRFPSGFRILLDTDTIPVACNEAPIPTGWVEQAILLASNSPRNER